jgi:hypothetical protein
MVELWGSVSAEGGPHVAEFGFVDLLLTLLPPSLENSLSIACEHLIYKYQD